MSLKSRTYSAGRWTAASALVRTSLQLVQTVILARLLVPADFGLMAVTVSILTVAGLFVDLGVSRAIIHFDKISKEALARLYWINLFMALMLSSLLLLSAPSVAKLFGLDGLTHVLMASSPVFVLSAIGQQFRVLSEKALQFRKLAFLEVAAAAFGFTAAIISAVAGGGVYSLVISVLVSAATSSALALWWLSDGHLPELRWGIKGAKPFLQFGGYLIGEGIINTLIRQADILVAGFMVSPSALGLFSLPRDLSMRVSMAVNPIITRVGFPVMSRLQHEGPALRSVYLQTLRMTASVNFPAYVALGLFAEEVVALLYGAQWKDAVIYLRILAAWGITRSTANPVGSLLHAVGAVRRSLGWNVAVLLIAPFLYWMALRGWSLTGLAIALVGFQVALIIPSWYFLVRPCCGARMGEYLAQLATPLTLALIAGAVAWLAVRGMPHGALRLLLGSTIGGIVYLAVSRAFNRLWFDAMWVLLNLPTRTGDP